jgi:RNA polymerase sigma-70 factor (ECF subfamily)
MSFAVRNPGESGIISGLKSIDKLLNKYKIKVNQQKLMSKTQIDYREFKRYYQQYKDKVYTFMYYRSGLDKELTNDLVSETFLKAYENFANFDDNYAFSTWIYTIARNVFIDQLRKNKGTKVDLQELDQITETTSEELELEIDQEISYTETLKLLKKLPDLQRECIMLKYLSELSTKEIAATCEISEANVRQAISRGLKNLRANSLEILPALIIYLLS